MKRDAETREGNDAGTQRRGDAGKNRRGDAGTRGRGEKERSRLLLSPRLRVSASPRLSFIASPRLLLLFAILFSIAIASLRAESTNDDASARARNLHQWGAVTLFHGLPSDRVRALAQDADGAMWFGTDNGLARYDGRRTQSVQIGELANARVLALRFDDDGVLWAGTDAGAARFINGSFQLIEATRGKVVTAIAPVPAERGHVWLATQQGLLFDCQTKPDGTLDARPLPEQALTS